MKKIAFPVFLLLLSIGWLTAQPGTKKFSAGNFAFVANYALSDGERMQLPPTSMLVVRNDTMQINLPYGPNEGEGTASRILQWTTSDFQKRTRNVGTEGAVVEMSVADPGTDKTYIFTLKTSPGLSRAQLRIEASDSTATSYTGFVN